MIGGLLSRLAGSFGFGGGQQAPQAGYGGMQTTMGNLRDPMPQQMGQAMPNYAHQMGYRGGMQNPEAAMMAQRYGGGQAGYGGMNPALQKGNQMIQDFNGTFPDPRQDPSVMQDMAPQPARPVQPGMQNDIDRMMMSNDLGRMIPPGNSSPQANTQIGGAMGNNQGYGDLMGGQGGFANSPANGGGMPNYASQFGANRQNAGSAMSSARYGAGQQGYQGQRPTANPFSNIQSLMPGAGGQNGAFSNPNWLSPSSQAGSMAGSGGGMLSKIGGFAKQFKPLSSGGNTIGGLFKPGGMTNNLLGKMGKTGAAISSAPAWAMPAAGAAAFGVKHLMKRSKQKKQQKQMNSQRDQIKNAAANGQYLQGNLGNFSGPQNF